MSTKEIPLVFDCEGEKLLGIIHVPTTESDLGVLIMVGGPQYRVGSHRQFVLLARVLALQGVPVIRFDYRGMGDSTGETDFENTVPDISATIDRFIETVPGIKNVVIWGLCDAASSALFYAHHDDRVQGIIMLNPWVRTEESVARTYLKHYYLERILSGDFWLKIINGKWNMWSSIKSCLGLIRDALTKQGGRAFNDQIDSMPLPERMADCLEKFKGKVLIILSGKNDYVANEFRDVISNSAQWRALTNGESVSIQEIADANHTFSSAKWRAMVSRFTCDWLASINKR